MRRLLFYGLFLMGSAAAAVYTVPWMQKYQLAFGSTPSSVAFVAALCLAGISLGSLVGARMSTWGPSIRHYGLAEISLGAGALWAMGCLQVGVRSYPYLHGRCAGHAGLLFVAGLALALVSMGPATVAMGARLPLLIQATVIRRDHLARQTGLLHTMNILGLAAGAALTGLLLPFAVGIIQSVYLAVAVNLLAGIAALALSGHPTQEPSNAGEGEVRSGSSAVPPRRAPVLKVAAAMSGFGLFALLALHARLWSQLSEGSIYSVAMMLIPYLGFLAAGSVVVAIWLDPVDPWRWLAWTQAAAVLAILVSPFLLAFFMQAIIPGEGSFSIRLVRYVMVSSLALGPAALLLGMLLPCTWKAAGGAISEIGHQTGVLTACYLLAAAIGILLAGWIGLPWLGPYGSVALAACCVTVVAVTGFWLGYRGPIRWAGGLGTAGIVVLWYGLGAWPLSPPMAEGERVLSHRDGNDATVTVIEASTGHRRLDVNRSYTRGSTLSALRDARRGRLPMLLHPNPQRVAIMGVATGVAASALLDFPVQRVVAVERLPSVVDVLPHFEPWNRSFYKDHRVELVVGRQRSYLLGAEQPFDLIISNLSVPWHPANADLCTVEHFQVSHQRLAPGGMFVQWLSGRQWTMEELRTVVASALEVFPAVTLWRDDLDVQWPNLGLIAYRDQPVLDTAATIAACARMAECPTLPAPLLSDPASVQMLYVCGDTALRKWAGGATLNTDNRPVVVHATAKSLSQRDNDPHRRINMLAPFRPRKWYYDEPLARKPSPEDLCRAADLIDDASVAAIKNNFEQEYRILTELAQRAGDVRAVAEYVLAVAVRYQQRNMPSRAERLLTMLTQYPNPPLAALGVLADARNLDGAHDDAIALMERFVDQAPDRSAMRRKLAQWLENARRYEQAQPHLQRLVNDFPKDPYLRLDLAHVLDRQGKTSEAQEQVDAFKKHWNGEDARRVWRYLRRLGLAPYATEPSPARPDDPSTARDNGSPPDRQEMPGPEGKNANRPDENE